MKKTRLVLAVSLLCAPPVLAAKSAAEVCKSLAQKAQRTLWSSVREAGDAAFCRKSWVPQTPDEFAACALWSQGQLFSNKLKNEWNAFFQKADAEWATWGPRSIAAEFEQGTIQGGFKRSYFGAGTAYSRSTIEVAKEGGKAEAFVTVCTLDYDGNVQTSSQKGFASGSGGVNTTLTFKLTHDDNRIVGVVVDTPASVNSFEYRARMLSEPIRNDLPPVKGIADLHVHQMVHLAFGGRMYWGEASGPESTALAKEVINPLGTGLDLSNVENFVQQLAGSKGVDANLLFAVINAGTTDEGFFKYGGEGFPSFRDWPHHADRSHQQAYLSWLKEAHTRGKDTSSNLNLIVVSPVNNNILCSVAKAFDPFGNVPERNASGSIVGWTSGTWGCADHENVQRQIKAMHDIEKANSWYRVAMTPWHARQIIADGDLAVVVAMETDKPLSGEGNNYGNWEQQLDFYRALGMTTMQIVHESNSIFCGAAPHRNMMTLLQLIHFPVTSVVNLLNSGSTFQLDQQRYNVLGITEEGRKLVDAMKSRNMPIDLAHGSQRCRRDVMARLGTSYALYDSHTKFKRLMEPDKKRGDKDFGTRALDREQEFLITEEMIPDYKKHQVLIGLRPASIDVYDAPDAKVKNDCPGSANSFAQLVQYASDQGMTFAYGTDFNTGVSQLGPRFGSGRCWAAREELKKAKTERPVGKEGALPSRASTVKAIAGTNYYTSGMATYGWMPELTIDLADNLKTPGASKLRDSAEAYLKMWERAYPPEGTPAAPNVERPKCKQDGDCPAGQWCNAGVDIAQNKCEAKKGDGESCPLAGGGHACKSGQCSLGHCFTPGSVAMGGNCYVDGACNKGKCSAIDGALGICVCAQDPDCASTQWCNAGLDLKMNACIAKKSDNESCAALGGGHQCKSGQCKWAHCFTPASVAMGGACYTDEACRQGKCSAVDGARGSCVCKADADCGSGFWCDAGLDLNKNACKAKLAGGAVCGKVGEVGVGHRCKSGECKVSGLSTNLKCK